ncbi:hypothetical protein C1D09_003370 [Mesorhizobium intechi]|uniref:Uncharacterized protein n=1 Tax=Mesorhizobium intechi TaxID=537601 RepID=A0A8T9AZ89_9HYPH|nr:hypothetical protein [Mesorhizobium intechi]TSE13528.1 hypothetical protein C1D09_003370 [Mesorhizobium intechi]
MAVLTGFGILTLAASVVFAEPNADIGVLIAVGDIMYCGTNEAAEVKETAKLAVDRIAAARGETLGGHRAARRPRV